MRGSLRVCPVNENLARQAELARDRQGDYGSLCYEGTWHSSGRLADRAARLATGLPGLGVRPGDRLLVLMANCPEVLVTYTAAWRAGAVVTPLIFLVSEEELRHALNDSGAVGVVTTAEFLPKVTGALAGAPEVRFVLVPGAGSAAAAAPGVPVLDFDQVASGEPGPSPAARAPTWPRCSTPAARPAGPRASRSPTRACTGAARPPTSSRFAPRSSPRSWPSRWPTPTACWSSAAACTGPTSPGPSSCAGSTRPAG